MSRSVDDATLPRDIDVLVIGAGHAGLAMSSFLDQAGREHLVIDRRDHLGGGWPVGPIPAGDPELDFFVPRLGVRRRRS